MWWNLLRHLCENKSTWRWTVVKFPYRTFSSGLPSARDGRFSRSPLMVLVDRELVTVVIFEVFEEADEDGSIIIEEVNGDGCSVNTIDEDDNGWIGSGGGSKSALGTAFEPSWNAVRSRCSSRMFSAWCALDAVRTSKKATKAKRWSSILTDWTRPCLDLMKIKQDNCQDWTSSQRKSSVSLPFKAFFNCIFRSRFG